MENRIYIAIDLKSYYSSVECVDKNYDPLKTNLVVADESRTDKTICLAVSPSLKAYGIPGRPRLFEVKAKINGANRDRLLKSGKKEFTGKSFLADELNSNPELEIDFVIATPRMARYMEMSTNIYKVYLKYIAPEDIHIYSIDEVFIDATNYLNTYKMTAHELALTMIRDVLKTTGITATAGIGTNLYLAKIAMDIIAKHVPANKDGVRIAELDEKSYRQTLWNHRPLTDFWRVGKGYAQKLEMHHMYTMGDVARCSIGTKQDYHNADLLFNLFGVNAELLIDHAWGYEPCLISEIKEYVPENRSICSGQVLDAPYPYDKGRLIVKEMADLLALDLVSKKLVTDQITLTVGYDIDNLIIEEIAEKYHGEITIDRYGRKVPKHAHGTIHLDEYSSSSKEIIAKTKELYGRIMNPDLLIRRVTLEVNNVISESQKPKVQYEEIDIFADFEEQEKQDRNREKEKNLQQAMLKIQRKFGKNGILKGMNLEEGAKTRERNQSIGGHKA